VQGGALELTSTLRPAGPDTWAGTLRCRSLSSYGRCLARVGSLAITFRPDGQFVAAVQLGALCTATGVGTPGTALTGNYSVAAASALG
jgi:hypothetical protein